MATMFTTELTREQARRLDAGDIVIDPFGNRYIVTAYSGVLLLIDLSCGLSFTRPQLNDRIEKAQQHSVS